MHDDCAGKVKMSHVDEAINEMFQATHMQMMRNCCRLDKTLLASILLESRSKGVYPLSFPFWTWSPHLKQSLDHKYRLLACTIC